MPPSVLDEKGDYVCPYSVNYFWGRLLREEAEYLLKERGSQPGFYLLRESTWETGIFIISICTFSQSISHFLMERLPNDKIKIENSSEFNDPISLIEFNKHTLDGLKVHPRIPCNRKIHDKIFYFNLIESDEFQRLIKYEKNNSNEYYKHIRNIVRNMHLNKDWYIDKIDPNVKNQLDRYYDGHFLIRRSKNSGCYVIHLCFDGKILDYKIHINQNGKFQLSETSKKFDSLFELVDNYSRYKGLPTLLKLPYEKPPVYEKVPHCAYVEKNNLHDQFKSDDLEIDENSILISSIQTQTIDSYIDSDSNYESDRQDEPKNIDIINLKRKERLGAGDYGEVYKYILTTKYGNFERELPLAGKEVPITFNSNKKESEYLKIKIEAKLMFNLKCPFIVELYGICNQPSSLLLLLEYAPLGCLKNYLKKNPDFPILKIFRYCYQVCVAMEYLSSKKVVHRDLACRNILLFTENLAKISDFGLSREIEENAYYHSVGNGKAPFKYIPPETFEDFKFSEKTDIWAYGITFWEALSYGSEPYSNLRPENLRRYLENNNRLEKPDDCPEEIYKDILLKTWHHLPDERPSFCELRKLLKNSLSGLFLINMDNELRTNSLSNYYQCE